eukprot:7268404-Heterocapsa_arctica.AAC.1
MHKGREKICRKNRLCEQRTAVGMGSRPAKGDVKCRETSGREGEKEGSRPMPCNAGSPKEVGR